MERAGIIHELIELNSTLSDLPAGNVYTVPADYFEDFAGIVLNRVKAMTAINPQEELRLLAPIFQSLPKQVPFSIPQGYFDTLPESVMAVVSRHEDYQTADEELSSLSPLLSSIRKQVPYSVPEGYFENLGKDVTSNSGKGTVAKTVSMFNRRWLRFAAAAVVIGFITFTGVSLFFNKRTTVSVANTHAWVEENMKKVSTDDINSFIQPSIAGTDSKATDISDMMKDISDKDIQNFLNETPSDDNSDDLLLN